MWSPSARVESGSVVVKTTFFGRPASDAKAIGNIERQYQTPVDRPACSLGVAVRGLGWCVDVQAG